MTPTEKQALKDAILLKYSNPDKSTSESKWILNYDWMKSIHECIGDDSDMLVSIEEIEAVLLTAIQLQNMKLVKSNTIDAIQEDGKEAMEFAEWLRANDNLVISTGLKWHYQTNYDNLHKEVTTEQLYELFKQSK